MPLLCEPGDECLYREFVFGGYGTETIHVINKIAPDVAYSTKLARWRFMQSTTLEALKAMPVTSKTQRHNMGGFQTFSKHSSVTIYEEDWGTFADLMAAKIVAPEGVKTYFYKAKHGITANVTKAVAELRRILTPGFDHVVLCQLHFGVEYMAPGALITFSYAAMSTLAKDNAWSRVTRYKKYYLRGGYGHFSGLREVTFSKNITYGQGYDTIAHVLPNKTTPPAWMMSIFNGFMSAPAGSQLSALGARISTASGSTRKYLAMAQEAGIGARAEFVYSTPGAKLERTLNECENISAKIDEILVRSEALVIYPNFAAEHKNRGMFHETSPLVPPERVVTNYPFGGLITRPALTSLMDGETITSVWLQSSTRHTNDARFKAIRIKGQLTNRFYGAYHDMYEPSGIKGS